MSEPKRIGKYELIEELGRGGFAAVYKARDTNLDRLVALKVLHPYWQEDFTFTARFHREAQKAASLQHPNIVTIYEAGEIETQPYIAMTYIDGVTLQALLEGERTLSYEETIDILDQVAKALDYAHSQGVVHRDIKPANIMIQPSAEGGQVFLLDFGLLKMTEGSLVLTSAGTILGSPEYMAPEQAVPEGMAEVGPAADRYALGVVAYHMLTGRVPFQGNSPGTLKAHEYDPVPPPQSFRPEIPEAAADAVEKMLAKSPEARFDTAVAFVAEVKRAIQQEKNLAPIYS